MKRKMVLTIAVMVALAAVLAVGQGAVLAQAGVEERPLELGRQHGGKGRFAALKEFQEEIITFNTLRIQQHQLQIEVITNHNEILPLAIAAVDEQNFEVLKQAGEVKALIADLHAEMKRLQEQINTERRAFREQARNGNFDEAREHAEMVITLKAAFNEQLEQKLVYQAEIIGILTY